MNTQLTHNCAFMQMHTNNSIIFIKNTLFDNNTPFFINIKIPFYF